MLRADLLLSQLADGHEKLIFLENSFQWVEDSKALYTLAKEKISNFERDCSGLWNHLDQMSSFFEEVK